MLVDDSPERSLSTRDTLSKIGCEVVAVISSDMYLLNEVERIQPDIVIIDIDLPDRDMLENLRSAQSNSPKPMVMFSQDDDGHTIRRAVEAGVSAYVVDGIKAGQVRPILDAAIATFGQFQNLKQQLDDSRTELSNRKIIDKAKGILMKQRQLDEAEAYHLMRKTAMNQKKQLIDIASQIIETAEILGVIK